MDLGLTVGLGGILIGIISSYIFYRRSIRFKAPSWAVRSNNLVRGHASTPTDLRITYRDKVVPNLTVSKVLLWNDGRETIGHDDLSTVNPLRIHAAQDVSILDASVLASNRTANQASIALQSDGKSARVTFAYLDKRQGAVFQIVHDGTSSSDLQVEGDIKGVDRIRSRSLSARWRRIIQWPIRRLTRARRAVPVISFALSLAYAVLAVGYWLAPPSSPALGSSIIGRVVNAGILLIGSIALFAMAIDIRRSLTMAPPGLEVFYE